MREKPLYTLGYEGSTLDNFLLELDRHGIRRIIDVRELPLSRKRGFSKNALAAALKSENVEYTHLRALGDPKAGREAARKGDLAGFRRIYSKHLETTEAQEALQAAGELAGRNPSALLCYERNHAHCHRAMIAASLLVKFRFRIVHIEVQIRPLQRSRFDVDRHISIGPLG